MIPTLSLSMDCCAQHKTVDIRNTDVFLYTVAPIFPQTSMHSWQDSGVYSPRICIINNILVAMLSSSAIILKLAKPSFKVYQGKMW